MTRIILARHHMAVREPKLKRHKGPITDLRTKAKIIRTAQLMAEVRG